MCVSNNLEHLIQELEHVSKNFKKIWKYHFLLQDIMLFFYLLIDSLQDERVLDDVKLSYRIFYQFCNFTFSFI